MKRTTIAGIIAALALFAGLVVYSTLQAGQVECEVCLTFPAGEVCRSGRGATEAEALMAAQESACGGNVSGMAEIIACRNQTPSRAFCQAAP